MIARAPAASGKSVTSMAGEVRVRKAPRMPLPVAQVRRPVERRGVFYVTARKDLFWRRLRGGILCWVPGCMPLALHAPGKGMRFILRCPFP
jgi:hypothetical protein